MKWSNNNNFYPTFTLISRDQHLVPSISTTSTEGQCGLVAIPSIQKNIRDYTHSLDLSIHYILIANCKCCIELTCVNVKAEGPHPCSPPSSPYGRIAHSSSYPHKTAHHDAVSLRYMGKYAQAPCTGLGSSMTKLWGHDLYSRCVFSSAGLPFAGVRSQCD